MSQQVRVAEAPIGSGTIDIDFQAFGLLSAATGFDGKTALVKKSAGVAESPDMAFSFLGESKCVTHIVDTHPNHKNRTTRRLWRP